MNLFIWQDGRQSSGYKKMLLGGIPGLCDLYLLKYPKGSFIPRHNDPLDSRRHYRFNLLLKKAKRGGYFLCESYQRVGPLVFFRPDIHWHEVTKVEEGSRFVLSLGVSLT